MRICMFGFGKVGMELIRQTWQNPDYKYISVSDSSGILSLFSGFKYNDLVRLVSLKERGGKVAEYKDKLAYITHRVGDVLGNRPDIIVDVSSYQTHGLLKKALGKGFHVVGSNKRPYADVSFEQYGELFSTAGKKQKVIDNRTVVSANLGVLRKVREFVSTAGGIYYTRGGLSGTMGYVSWRMNQGASFSEAFKEAIAKGYTESDFRDDMRGLDSARKAVIIGRTNGYQLDLSDIELEKLVPPEMESVGTKEAVGLLPMMDREMGLRVEAARKGGCVLKYVAELDFDRGNFKVGFSEIPLSDPQAFMMGTWNKVTIFPRSHWDSNPISFEGPGAGIGVTAQGLAAGLYDIANIDKVSKLNKDAINF